ncbi:MAG: amidase [Betaproteobacteria bacterium]|nr:amidase [Betaproteobacteria bacterium]
MSVDTDLLFSPATELAKLVCGRQVSPVELMRMLIARIETMQPKLNCFITVCADEALHDARLAEEAVMSGQALGPLHGVPFTAKDLINTQGVRTTYGSLIFAEHVPQSDTVAIARMKAAGAILVGKTTTPEFGQKGLTEAPLFGKTRNAWRADRTCGGSSGGSAVAVASGLAPLSIATDGGGSTRIPAACNGVVGIKQSLGVVPVNTSQDAFGNISYTTPMTRTVADTALMLDVMGGPHISDPHTLARVPPRYLQSLSARRDLRGVRIGWRPLLGNRVLSTEVRTACERALALLTEAGAEVFEPTEPFDNAEELWLKVNGTYRLAQFGHHLAQHRDRMDPTLAAQLDNAGKLSAEELYRAIFLRTKLYRAVQSWFDHADVIITPTLACTALPIEHQFFDLVSIDGELTDTMRRAWYPYALPFNMTGNPAISVPCAWSDDGLPIGLQMIGRLHEDVLLLQMDAQLEARLEWGKRRPTGS